MGGRKEGGFSKCLAWARGGGGGRGGLVRETGLNEVQNSIVLKNAAPLSPCGRNG